MLDIITTKDIAFMLIAIGAWCTLGIIIFKGFIWLQIQERDTPFPEEAGQSPERLHIGRGGMNGARPTRKKFSRLALYSDFFVAGFKAQRVALPYSAITSIELYDRNKRDKNSWLMIRATQPETEKEFEIYFLHAKIDDIYAAVESKR